MDVRKHYKMFKKGKKWCCMALTAVAVATGTMMATQTANADTAQQLKLITLLCRQFLGLRQTV